MIALWWLFLAILASPFKLRCQLEVENVALHHQVVVLRRQMPRRVRLANLDRLFLVQLYRWLPSILTVIRKCFANETLATNTNKRGQMSSES